MKVLFWGSDGATCVFLSTWVPVPYLVLLPEADLHHPLELRSDLLVAGAVEEEDAAAEDAVEHGEDAVEERSKRLVLGCVILHRTGFSSQGGAKLRVFCSVIVRKSMQLSPSFESPVFIKARSRNLAQAFLTVPVEGDVLLVLRRHAHDHRGERQGHDYLREDRKS